MSYLVVDASDDVIVAECDSAKDVRPVLEQMQQELPQREVFVVWFGERRGELVSTQSLVTVRGLTAADGFALYRH
jgi:hypothetical protein